MSLETEHFIKGIPVRPVNADDIGFKYDWTKEIREAELTTDSIILNTKAKQIVIDHINTLGIFEGIPYTAKAAGVTLEYYIDLTDNPRISGVGDDEIEVKIKRRKAVDYFLQQADGTTWDLVNKNNPIDVFDTEYLIVRDNQAELLIMLFIALYNLNKAFVEGIFDLVAALTDFIKAVTPNAGAPSVDTGDIISAAILATARSIYVTAIAIAITKLTVDIIQIIFPPIKKFKTTTVLELLIKGCAELGFTLVSSVPEWANMTILAKPTLCPSESIWKTIFKFDNGLRTKGYPVGIAGDTVTTFGALIDFCLSFCNGKPRTIGTEFHIHPRNFWNDNSGITIHNTLTLQDRRENQWTFNTGEAWKRYYMKYQQDTMDVHTFDNAIGIYSEHSTEPLIVQEPDLVLIKGLVPIVFPFALGSRKAELNFIEKAFIPFAAFGDSVINFFGGSSSLVSDIEGRVGKLQISQQMFSVTKLLYTVGGDQPENYLDIIGAEAAYQKYHTSNQVKENFKRIHSATIPFSSANFAALQLSNYVNDQNGNPLEILTLEWVNESKTAQIQYAILSNEGFNTETILIEGGGANGTTTTSLTC